MRWLKNKFIRLAAIVAIAAGLRFWGINHPPYFADMGWFFASARQTLISGQLPLLGITASITWLHQGPLWTYFLLLPTAVSLPPQVLTALAGVAAVALAYFVAGPVAAAVMALLPFAVTSSLTPYHTSLIPLFFFLSYLCVTRRRPFLGGLFIGFLYQSHLLTFIYWPLFLYLAVKKKLSILHLASGFVVGVLPFILAGPVQTLGIFVWLTKQILTGFGGVSSGISTAYWQVLLPGGLLLLGRVIKWLHAHRHSFSSQ